MLSFFCAAASFSTWACGKKRPPCPHHNPCYSSAGGTQATLHATGMRAGAREGPRQKLNLRLHKQCNARPRVRAHRPVGVALDSGPDHLVIRCCSLKSFIFFQQTPRLIHSCAGPTPGAAVRSTNLAIAFCFWVQRLSAQTTSACLLCTHGGGVALKPRRLCTEKLCPRPLCGSLCFPLLAGALESAHGQAAEATH